MVLCALRRSELAAKSVPLPKRGQDGVEMQRHPGGCTSGWIQA